MYIPQVLYRSRKIARDRPTMHNSVAVLVALEQRQPTRDDASFCLLAGKVFEKKVTLVSGGVLSMSIKSRIENTARLLSAAFDSYKKAIARCVRQPQRVSSADPRRTDHQYEILFASSVKDWPLRKAAGDRMDLDELIAMLRIGDRVRLFCDDGLLVAEKVSHTRLRVIYSQATPSLVQ